MLIVGNVNDIFENPNLLTKQPGIYYFKNLIDNKYYIGQAINIFNRIKQHKGNYTNNFSHAIYSALRKYGLKNFEFGYLELLNEIDKAKLDELEKQYIKEFNSYGATGYNMTVGGDAGVLGYKLTEENKKRISNTLKAKNAAKYDIQCYLYYVNTNEIFYLTSLNELDDQYNYLHIRRSDAKRLLDIDHKKPYKKCLFAKSEKDIEEKINWYNIHKDEIQYNSGMFGHGNLYGIKGMKFPNRKTHKRTKEANKHTAISMCKYYFKQYDMNMSFIKEYNNIIELIDDLHYDRLEFNKCKYRIIKDTNLFMFDNYLWERIHK